MGQGQTILLRMKKRKNVAKKNSREELREVRREGRGTSECKEGNREELP